MNKKEIAKYVSDEIIGDTGLKVTKSAILKFLSYDKSNQLIRLFCILNYESSDSDLMSLEEDYLKDKLISSLGDPSTSSLRFYDMLNNPKGVQIHEFVLRLSGKINDLLEFYRDMFQDSLDEYLEFATKLLESKGSIDDLIMESFRVLKSKLYTEFKLVDKDKISKPIKPSSKKIKSKSSTKKSESKSKYNVRDMPEDGLDELIDSLIDNYMIDCDKNGDCYLIDIYLKK